MTRSTSICVLLILLVGTWQLAVGQDTTGAQEDDEVGAARDAPADTGAYVPQTEDQLPYRPPQQTAELHQGKVGISTTDSGMYEIRRNDSIIGSTPNTFTQRRGTERVYSIRDSKGRVLCRQSVLITFAYQMVELVCDTRTGEFSGHNSDPTYVDTPPPTYVDTAP
jgi:hypothetical protein